MSTTTRLHLHPTGTRFTDPLYSTATEAVDELRSLHTTLESMPFCDGHGDPYADNSCVERDIEGRIAVTELLDACTGIAECLPAAICGHPTAISDLKRELRHLEAVRSELLAAIKGVEGHPVGSMFTSAVTLADELVTILDASVAA